MPRPKLNLISHFYNEEYLLPFWIEWYKKLDFDTVTLIDYDSTDQSLQILKDSCPNNWRVIPSKNKNFCAPEVDAEVNEVEKRLDGWKICLNTTEFLLPSKNLFEMGEFEATDRVAYSSLSLAIADDKDNYYPKSLKDFISGFKYGVSDYVKTLRSDRYFHNALSGNYNVGRHQCYDLPIRYPHNKMFVCWLGYYPWNEKFHKRKLQIKTRIPQSDIESNYGFQHRWPIEKINLERKKLLEDETADLLSYEDYRQAYNYAMDLL